MRIVKEDFLEKYKEFKRKTREIKMLVLIRDIIFITL